MSDPNRRHRVLLGAALALVAGVVVIAAVLAFSAATGDQAAQPGEPVAPEVAQGEGFERYGQADYVPVARDNARTLMFLFGGIGVAAVAVILLAVLARRRERADD